jgi:hypothetical protein
MKRHRELLDVERTVLCEMANGVVGALTGVERAK